MDDFGMLARDFGYRPQGKSAPMASSKSSSSSAGGTLNFGIRSNGGADHNRSSSNRFNSTFNDRDRVDGMFGGLKYTSSASDAQGGNGIGSRSGGEEFDALFQRSDSKSSSLPVFDKPVYDDDIFDGLPGVKNPANLSAKYDDVFASISSPPSKHRTTHSDGFDDLMSNFGNKETESRNSRVEKDAPVFDDLLPGFGGSGTPSKRQTSAASRSQRQPSNSTSSNVMEDPFAVLESNSTPTDSTSGSFTVPLEEYNKHSSSEKSRQENSSIREGVFDAIDPFDSLRKFVPPVSSETKYKQKDRIPGRAGPSMSSVPKASIEPIDKYPIETSDSSERKVFVENFQESRQTISDMPNVSTDFHGSIGQTTFPPSYINSADTNSQVDVSPISEENLKTVDDDVWLTVSEIPLFTQPISAPPPSRPPPPRPARVSKQGIKSFGSTNAKEKVYAFSSFPSSTQYSHSPKSARAAVSSSTGSQIDELEDFAMGRTWNSVNEHETVHSVEEVGTNSDDAAAAMREAVDRAEARFKHAKEVRERDHLKAARSKEAVLNEDEKTMQDNQDKELREKKYTFDRERYKREKEEEEREQRRLEREKERVQEMEREREEKEREQRRLDREREREKARQAVERATREARERAAAEARLKAEKAAFEKATADRERSERAAVQRAHAEARQRLAVEARERAEKAAAEAREREARERASASRSRAEAEARGRAERTAVEREAAARANQQKNDNDLESFFSMGTRPSSTPKSRANSSDPLFDTQAQSRERPEGARRTSVAASSNIRKAASATNIVDDLTSIFGAAPSSGGEFQEVEGESEERKRSRFERHQRTQLRAAKALAEKNQRDLQAQEEQAERHRIAETLDVEIKRWSAGKEGNLRALLSTMQYVLWPECGWQPVSLTDLITAAAVKKVYRKATLCIHPDKVQQKGANLQQKYIAEKVFDLLKEAWNKFNSEELF